MRSDTLTTTPLHEPTVAVVNRIKVHIRCRNCGETFILRGVRDLKGHVETGFKKCLCDNDHDFDIEPLA